MPEMTYLKLIDLVESGDFDSRRHGKEDGLDELAASIKAHGLLQSLVVRLESEGNYEVIDGNRRFRALKNLQAAGEITYEYQVPVLVREADDRNAAEMSLAANIVRLPLHQVDQFRAFAALIGEGKTPADIAASFGIAERTVRKRIALGNVHPPVLEAAVEGTVDSRLLIEFASAALDLQVRVWEKFESGEIDKWAMGRALSKETISAGSPIAVLVGEEAYLRAGGVIESDLFDDDDETIWSDTELATRLYWQIIKGKVDAQVALGRDAFHFEDPRVTDTDNSGWWQRIWDEADYPVDTEMSYVVERDGSVIGMIWRSKTEQAAPKPKIDDGISAALQLTLDQQLTEAAILTLSEQPSIAVALLAITMAQRFAVPNVDTGIACSSMGAFEHRAEDISPLNDLMRKVQKQANKLTKAKTLAGQLSAYTDMDADERHELWAGMVALSMKQMRPRRDLLVAMPVDVSVTFKPDATYFGRLKKDELLSIAAKENIAVDMAAKKSELVTALVDGVPANWLPDYLSPPKKAVKQKKAA
jgi:ParB/RepB/Spo0J family partition protein